MLIGLISDTHDHIPNTEKAVQLFKDRKVDLVIHCGDFCSPFMIPLFEGLHLEAIFGNNDGDKYLLMNKCAEIEADLEGEFFELQADDRLLAVYHGTYAELTEALHHCGKYDAVISGHTHETVQKKVGKTLAINPGTANGFDGKATIAFLETSDMSVEFVNL
ncbi:metallophosphoesterase [Balneolaceae bacterium YR4-1]|uniref:Phosphoesterase n=1 Tax=Halalkalibaculum roseum TaxID=2709311 RepID=A0A6M1SQ19_9BACT|nr:metallophosphoesterase [Halalkalibaculum roseum]NGP77461.1 metallophosphoesterase [Halalkalibaculum roseum]